MDESTVASALCGVMEQALIEKGIDPSLAKILSVRACQPIVGAIPSVTKKVVRRTSKAARKTQSDLSKAFKIANQRYRLKNGQLRKGRSQSDIARLAQKLRKKM